LHRLSTQFEYTHEDVAKKSKVMAQFISNPIAEINKEEAMLVALWIAKHGVVRL